MQENTYSLAVINSPNITGIRTLSRVEFEKISNEISQLKKFQTEEQLFRIIEFNYSDLKDKKKYYLNQFIVNRNPNTSEFSQYLDLNRLILNLLSSIRTYLDHTETRLKRNYGEVSEEFKLFKKLSAESFDNHFAYRFLAKLRNYSQHCGLPAGSISLTDNLNGQDLHLYLHRDNLLKNFDSWGALVKPDLQAQKNEFDIFPLIDNKISLLKDINTKISEKILKELKNEGKNLLRLIIETQKNNIGIPCILKVSGNINNPTMQMNWFPYEIIALTTGVKFNIIESERNSDSAEILSMPAK